MSFKESGLSRLSPDEMRPAINEAAEDRIHDSILVAASNNKDFIRLPIEDQVLARAAMGEYMTGIFQRSTGPQGKSVHANIHPKTFEEMSESLPERLRGVVNDIFSAKRGGI